MSDAKEMVKISIHFRRKPGMTLEEFEDYWERLHGPLVARIFPNLRKYVQVHPYSTSLPPDSPLVERIGGGDILRRDGEVDGCVEFYFDDMDAWLDAYNNWYLKEGGQELRDDEVKFADMASIRFFVGREVVIKDELGDR